MIERRKGKIGKEEKKKGEKIRKLKLLINLEQDKKGKIGIIEKKGWNKRKERGKRRNGKKEKKINVSIN